MSWLWWLQIAADVVLLAAVGLLLSRIKELGPGGGDQGAAAGAQRFAQEAEALAREFDRILGEKRELIQTTLKSLDARIAKLNEMASELQKAPAASRPEPSPAPSAPGPEPSPDPMDRFRRRVVELSRQGKKPAQIAQATGRPQGEVELVLGLMKSS